MLSVLDVCCRIKAQAMRFTQGGVTAQDAVAYGLTSGLLVVEQGELRFGPDFSTVIFDVLTMLKCSSSLMQRYQCALERPPAGHEAKVPLFTADMVEALVREGSDSSPVQMLKDNVKLRSHYLAIEHEPQQPGRGGQRAGSRVVAGVLRTAPAHLAEVHAVQAAASAGQVEQRVAAGEGVDGGAAEVQLVTDYSGLPVNARLPTWEHAMFPMLFPNDTGGCGCHMVVAQGMVVRHRRMAVVQACTRVRTGSSCINMLRSGFRPL